ncbi:peptidylprolyl isomerase [Pseudocolwellia sp. AS88]|uniref:peptidylprolyl isomerase n=1 Tax=Pseudocolwellia sp. AS88 TaxID=3063958 RepID=UPI0026F22863|nr:peptidylprolyl isomerase [Pseudocolwellia sp. AS88]MDO7086123.1 peptidylprolyl isomerase [Pseudocolwellia sp. AS88]
MLNKLIRKSFVSIFTVATAISCLSANATTVEFQTSQGNIHVNLFDEDTPETVANFLSYIEDGAYTDSIFHRSVADFIIQSGGYTVSGTEVSAITKNASVINEPVFSNVEGTIAMAKIAGDPDSATSEWFFNLADNSANLDLQNDGFTVFGQVITEGDDGVETLATLDAIANVATCNAAGFSDLPLVDYSCNSDSAPSQENFITINQVVIIDSSASTAQNLTPVRNTLREPDVEPEPEVAPETPSNSSGGSVFWMLVVLATGLSARLFSRKS